MKTSSKFFRGAVAFSITIGLFMFLLSTIDFVKVLAVLKTADRFFLFLGFFTLIFGNLLLDAFRWKVILQYLQYPVSFKEALFIKIVSTVLISSLPLKSGELSRLVYLKRLKGIPYSKTTLSIVAEYGCRIFTLFFCLCIGFVWRFFENQQQGLTVDLSHSSLILFSLCFFKWDMDSATAGRWEEQCRAAFQNNFQEFYDLLKNKIVLLATLLYSASDIMVFYWLARSLSLDIPVSAMLIFLPIILVISCLPFTIAGLGSRELAIVFFFQPYAPPEFLWSLGILYSVAEFALPFFIAGTVTAIFSDKMINFFGEQKSKTEITHE